MTNIVEKKRSTNNTPKARNGDHWLILSKQDAITSETGRKIEPAGLTLIFSAKAYHSPVGLGNTRLARQRIPVTDDGSVLSATLGQCTAIGSASYTNRAFIQRLIDEAPDASEVAEHFDILQTLAALSGLESISRRRLETYDYMPGWEHALITTGEKYGQVFVPKNAATRLQVADGDLPDGMRFTHVLCDVLGTKHAIMRKLGLDAAIELDSHLIGNSLRMAEASR